LTNNSFSSPSRPRPDAFADWCLKWSHGLYGSFLAEKPVKQGSAFSGFRVLLGGGFKNLLFSPLPGEMIQFDSYFSDGLKPPTS